MQIVVTVIIFIVTLTRGAPAFPVLIIALVPFRLLVMKRWWPREALRFVDAWACREGTPEDDEDARAKPNDEILGERSVLGRGSVLQRQSPTDEGGNSAIVEGKRNSNQTDGQRDEHEDQEIWGMTDDEMAHEWVGLDKQNVPDEEFGRHK